METNLKLGKFFGIPVGVSWSWFLVFGLVTWSLAVGYFPAEYRNLSTATYWVLGALTSILFFGSVLAHEFGHSLVALRDKVPVRGITLFIFGGVAQIEKEPPSASSEFRIAIAGPLTSFALAGIFFAIYQLDRSVPFLAAPSIWLARINLTLALFNLIPGFPLDGGRVLRSIVWAITNNFKRATQVASFSGQLIAFGFIGFGIFTALSGNFFNGLWFAFIGWFLQNAASASLAQVNMQDHLSGVKVSQVMIRDIEEVPGNLTLSQLVEEHVLVGGNRLFFITENGQLLGMLTLKDITRVPREQWSRTLVYETMTPYNRLLWVDPDTSLLSAIKMMDHANVAQVPVCGGKDCGAQDLSGYISREHVLHYLQTRAQLGV